jgi:hypothetical protein
VILVRGSQLERGYNYELLQLKVYIIVRNNCIIWEWLKRKINANQTLLLT